MMIFNTFRVLAMSGTMPRVSTCIILYNLTKSPEVSVKVLITQSCLTLCDLMNCSLPGSSVHEVFSLARILEWVAMPSSRGSS